MPNLKDKIKEFPKSPGVYQFLNENGEILYVGKAKNLNSRIRSYFLKNVGRGPIIENMIEQADDVRFVETDSEIEALLTEAELINRLKPKYNSRQKDDKSFLVIKIAKKRISTFPSVELVRYRNIDKNDKSFFYFGPYTSGELLKKSMKYLRKIFPYKDCSKTKWATYKKKGRSCIYVDIGICNAPCIDAVSAENYEKNIYYLKKFLRGGKASIIQKLESDIKKLSRNKNYEEASKVRDRLYSLLHIKNVAIGLRDDVFDYSNILFKRIECYDISNIGDDFAVGSMVVFTNGKEDKDQYRKFKIESNKQKDESLNDDLNRMKQVLERRFKNDWSKPDLIVIDGGENHLNIAKRVLIDYDLNVPVLSIAKGAKRDKNEFHYGNIDLAKYVNNNKDLMNIIIMARDEAHRFAISYYRKLHQKSMLES